MILLDTNICIYNHQCQASVSAARFKQYRMGEIWSVQCGAADWPLVWAKRCSAATAKAL